MKHRLRKLTSVVLAVIMVFSVLTIAPFTVSAAVVDNEKVSSISQSEFDSKLNALRSQYPNYSTWYSSFDGGSQCFGFARLMGYEMFGSYPSTWSVSYDFNSVKAGDIVRYGNNGSGGHSIFVTNVSGSTITFVDCNGNGNVTNGVWIPDKCVVKWDNTTTLGKSLFGYSFSYIRKNPGIESGNDPKGCVDGVTGGIGTVTVKGWAFDKDDISKSLDIHVYIGGPAGSGAEGHSIAADQYRPDVNSVYGVGDYHGFSSTIYTSLSGNQEVFIYGINTMGGSNVLLGSQTVFIDRDLYKPVIQTIYITDVTPYAFTVNAVISDDRGVSKVKFPTWKDGSPDVKWYIPDCVDTNTYSYRVHINDLTNEPGVYHTHVYAYDVGRNESVGSIDIIVPEKGLLIYEIVNGNIHIQGANDKTVNEISIPSTIDNKTVTEISDNAFFEFTSLSKITLPDTITRIGNNAFSECWHLKEFTCPSNLLNIGNNSFSCCYGLNKVSFNDNLQSVGDKAFYTTNLNSVCLPKGLSYFGEYSFGYKYDDNLLPQKYDFKIFGYSNSKIYAQNNGIEFISIDCIGDVNLDGTVNIDDVTLIQKYIANMSEFDSEQLKAADVTGDNDISIDDVTAIQKYLAGMITSFANA